MSGAVLVMGLALATKPVLSTTDSISDVRTGLVFLATHLQYGDLAAKASCTGRRCPIRR
jgi:hypothetical protein